MNTQQILALLAQLGIAANPAVGLAISLGIQYGPEFVTKLISILKNKEATLDDVEKLFADVKPYSAYGIPDKLP
jgi:hypothetical protein